MKIHNIFALLLVGFVSVGLNAITDEQADSIAKRYLKKVASGELFIKENVEQENTGPVTYREALRVINNSQILRGNEWYDMSLQLIDLVSVGIMGCRSNEMVQCIHKIITGL